MEKGRDWDLHGVLINFSNHPSSQWGDDQKLAARDVLQSVLAADRISTYEIRDIPFPAVKPGDDYGDLILPLLQAIKEERDKRNVVAVMVQGHYGLTFFTVQILQKLWILPVYAHTERIVEDLGNGQKKATFKFAGFEAYLYFEPSDIDSALEGDEDLSLWVEENLHSFPEGIE